jgi:hypothetical protein
MNLRFPFFFGSKRSEMVPRITNRFAEFARFSELSGLNTVQMRIFFIAHMKNFRRLFELTQVQSDAALNGSSKASRSL